MNEFIRALPEDRSGDGTRRFFPTTGDWSYEHTVHEAGGGTRIQRWVFPAAETSKLFGDRHNGVDPLWESFEIDYHGQAPGLLLYVIMTTDDTRWRLVGHNRFVPQGAPASSPIFVEWRREPGGWVISSYGDERHCGSGPLPGYAVGSVARLGLISAPTRPAYAANKPWFVNSEVLRLDGYRLPKYGQPREIESSVLELFGWKDDVAVYVEKGRNAEVPIVLYVVTGPDMYQPYQLEGSGPDPYCPSRAR